MAVTKYVKPADVGGKIFDPNIGDYIPDDGRRVVWDSYWERLDRRSGEIIVTSVRNEEDPEPAEEEQPPSPDAPPRRARTAMPAADKSDASAPTDAPPAPGGKSA